jgi:hypothetical protein
MTRLGLFIVLLLVASLTACGEDRHEYPAEVVKSFLTNCEARADERDCNCAIDELREKFTYEQFQSMEKRMSDRAVMQEMANAVAECR